MCLFTEEPASGALQVHLFEDSYGLGEIAIRFSQTGAFVTEGNNANQTVAQEAGCV